MSETLAVGAGDRVLILAPHPDDESLASGGLIQATLAVGGQVRVLMLTDGDNNPWPQRWLEKRWSIGATERARWGARRRQEATQALACLGMTAADVRYLGLPDLGLTPLLMAADAPLMHTLVQEFATFAPTRLVLPGLEDRHPDHSAAHVLACLALQRAALGGTEVLNYLVHTNLADAPNTRSLALTAAQVQLKHDAIAAHVSQVQLSGKRFLAFARPLEHFLGARHVAVARTGDRAVWLPDGIEVHLHDRAGRHEELLLVVDPAAADSPRIRLRLALSSRHGTQALLNRDDARVVGTQTTSNAGCILHIPLQTRALRPGLAYAKRQKQARGLMVIDRAGWFEVR